MTGGRKPCRGTEECALPDGHTTMCSIPVVVLPRNPASRLRYLADEVEKEWTAGRQLGISSLLRDLARELE